MKLFMKPLKVFVCIVAMTAIAPFVLAQLGFWSPSEAAEINFKDAHPPIQMSDSPRSYSEAVKRAAPAVVSIHSKKEMPKEAHPFFNDPFFRHFFGAPGQGNPNAAPGQQAPQMPSSIGSGVIISDQGWILTNNHVVKDSEEIEVRLSDGRKGIATVEGADPDSDLAILKVEMDELPTIALGTSNGLDVGDVVLAIGNPFGVGQTVTQGIVSATQRNELGINTFENFIQTDAAINPGNSGGALIDANGNLVGINNAIYSRTGGYQGIGFAIPIDLAKEVMSELIENGHVTRGWLGITVRRINDDLRKSILYPEGDGAVIAGVIRNGPAHKAGLQPFDVVISINGNETNDPSDLLKITSQLKPEEIYNISVVRKGETMDFKVIVGKRPVNEG